MNKRSQAVRLSKDVQFHNKEGFIRKQGGDVILSTRFAEWASYFVEGPAASTDFMEGVDDLPVQERKV